MLNHDTRGKLRNVIRGAVIDGATDHCTTIRNFLCGSYRTSSTVKKDFDRQSIIKKEQAESLNLYSINNNLWLKDLPLHSEMIAKGGEAQIYLDSDNRSVLKLNEGIYYATWLEFFNSLVIHNLLFKDTAYTFLDLQKKKTVYLLF